MKSQELVVTDLQKAEVVCEALSEAIETGPAQPPSANKLARNIRVATPHAADLPRPGVRWQSTDRELPQVGSTPHR